MTARIDTDESENYTVTVTMDSGAEKGQDSNQSSSTVPASFSGKSQLCNVRGLTDVIMTDGDNCYIPLIVIPDDPGQRGKFQCCLCNLICPSRSKLEVHFRSHTGERPFQCHKCPKSFYTQSSLDRHQKAHTSTAAYQCQVKNCNKKFKFRGDLARHERNSHASVRPFFCGYCHGSFKSIQACDRHVRTHFPEQRTFGCNMCSRTFITSSKLRIHTRTHTGEKPYVCPFPDCQRTFGDPSGFIKHKRTHWPKHIYPYVCDFCGKGYRHSPTLAKHKKKHHHNDQEKSNNDDNSSNDEDQEMDSGTLRKMVINQENDDKLQEIIDEQTSDHTYDQPKSCQINCNLGKSTFVPIVFDTSGRVTEPMLINIDHISPVANTNANSKNSTRKSSRSIVKANSNAEQVMTIFENEASTGSQADLDTSLNYFFENRGTIEQWVASEDES